MPPRRASARAPPGPDRDSLVAGAVLAALLEASADKPGNVSRLHDLGRTTYAHFLASSAHLVPALRRAADPAAPLGSAILQGVRSSVHAQDGGNVHLGVILLLFPLVRAAALTRRSPAPRALRRSLEGVLRGLDWRDSVAFYDAVHDAGAHGLAPVPALSVVDPATRRSLARGRVPLRRWMAVGTDVNAIAQEYVTGFRRTFTVGHPALARAWRGGLDSAIVHSFLELLADSPDTLVLGKQGAVAARAVQQRARRVLTLGSVWTPAGRQATLRLGRDLRRTATNPGATADLTAAALYVALLEGRRV